MSQSRLKDFAVSPAYYKMRLAEPKEQTEAMILGTAVHAALLEPEVFKNKYVVAPKFDRRTTKGKADYTLFCVENMGKLILTKDEYDHVLAMRDSVFSHPKAKDAFSFKIDPEKEIFFEMEGVACKAKLDAIVPEINTVIDFKTARSATAEQFRRDALSMGYDLQAFWYYEAYKAEFEKYPDYYAFIVVSKEAPYPVGFFEVDKEFLDRGRYCALKHLRKYKECLALDVWPKNESEDVIVISTPEWAMKETLEFGEAYFTTMTKES